jgi:glucosyl-3-phosphoglycerate synthase
MTYAPWTLTPTELDASVAHLWSSPPTIAVIIPAKDESATIGPVLDAVRQHDELITELVVVNDHSTDDTAVIAERHGARVVQPTEGTGKGEAMQAGVRATSADILVFLDADVLNTEAHYLPRLVAPLVARPEVQLVKGFYIRPLHDMPTGGGRVNELTARPILSLLYPGLGEVRQPLAGETAVRRSALTRCPLDAAYGVEMALLLDVATTFGIASVAQVDLGIRRHRNRPLEELRPMAVDILRVALRRYGVVLPD